jgi:hypothetical protein
VTGGSGVVERALVIVALCVIVAIAFIASQPAVRELSALVDQAEGMVPLTAIPVSNLKHPEGRSGWGP